MVRWLVMLGAMGGLTGCGLIDSLLASDGEDSSDSEGVGEAPRSSDPNRGSQDPSTAARLAECELGADAFCVCLDGQYECDQEAYDTLVKNCLQENPEADFVLCYADQVDANLEIDCRDAAQICLDVTFESGDTGSGPSDTGGGGGSGGNDEDTAAPPPPTP